MSLCLVVDTAGFVVQAATQPENPATCNYVLVSGGEYGAMVAPDFATLGITSGDVTTVFLWGFSAVIGSWVLGLCGGWAAQAVKNAG